MAIAGSTSEPTFGAVWYGLNSRNQFCSGITLPAGGPWRIYRVGVWMAGQGETARTRLCMWDSSNNLLRQGAEFTAANRSFPAPNGDSVAYESDISDYVIAGGGTVLVGFHTHSDDNRQFPHNSGGTRKEKTVGDAPISMASSTLVTGSMGVWLYYEAANDLPTAPTLTSPANGARLTDLTPDLDWTHNDPNGDAQVARQIQVDNNSDFSSPLWDSTASTSSTIVTYAGSALSRGVTYYWRVRTSDAEGYGPWSSSRTFIINRLPTATKTSPPTAGFPYLHNLGDAAAWTSGAAGPRPRFTWTFSDADGDAQTAYQVKVYSASSGGSTLYDSGQVASSSKTLDAAWAGVYGTEYWWTINVRDAYNEWSGESSRTAFKMRFGQAIYEFALPALNTSGWQWSNAAAAGGQVAFLFRTASGAGGAGATAWKTSIGAVTRITSGTEYLNVMVRLAPTTAGANVTLPDMTFTYIAAAIQPEKWTIVGGADVALDGDVRRYGSQSLRFSASAAADRYAYQNMSVSPHTDYVLSGYVNTGAVPTTGLLRLRALDEAATLIAQSDPATDTSGSPEGWYKMTVKFNSGDSSIVRVAVWMEAPAIGDTAWFDALQLEEGVMGTPWRPGLVGDAAVIDVGGVIIDGLAGGIFRLRTSGGNQISLTADGLEMDDGWIAPTLINNWVNYGGTWNDAGYRKDASGFVHLRGLLKSGSIGSAFFTLPAGYRPGAWTMFVGPANLSPHRIDVSTTGSVIPHATAYNTGNNGYISIDGIIFKAEA